MEKIDYKKKFKPLYTPSQKEVSLVEVPVMNFLMVDGQGDPNTSQSFHDAIEVLYSVSYTLKFMIKKSGVADYTVPPLEGLWWCDDMTEFSIGNKEIWKWTLMIMQPEYVTKELLEQAIAEVERKKNPVALPKLRFEAYHEGVTAQIMHIGPFSEEGPTIEKLHAFIRENNYEMSGKHHELYLSDMRRCAPEKLKTVLRQPVKKIT
ncbi:MAG: GyrI-like domain-containing protein [Pseudomonadota bacterium]